MKKSIVVLFPLFGLLLSGCNFIIKPNVFPSSNTSGDVSSDTSSTSSTSHEHGETATIEIYATNDIHGHIYADSEGCGVGKLMTYLYDQKQNPNTLLLDQGDTWQGSIYSNYNHGACITDVMNFVHYDARSVGNHDFDWGPSYIAQNYQREYNGYTTPVLAGNVYDYNFDTRVVGTAQQSQLGGKSITYTLPNGIKVGILGGIGSDQITSINTLYVKDLIFKDHIAFIKEEATHLRNDLHCDVVICSIHTGQSSVLGNNLADYVDLVLCGHTHDVETANEGSIWYAQAGCNTEGVNHITLTYDFDQADVINTSIDFISHSSIESAVTTINPTINNIINTYADQCNAAANVVVANNVNGQFKSNGSLPNLMCRAIYDQCVSEGYDDVILTNVNVARADAPYNSWTYADLYEAFPFDNVVYIAEITGYELINQVNGRNYRYINPNYTNREIQGTAKYKIAVLDYLYFHTNSDRYFDYFSYTGGTSTKTLSKNYREILRDWLISNGYDDGLELDYSDFVGDQYAKNQFTLV